MSAAGDYGIRISKPLYDVRTAGDSDLIFNSAWPSISQVFPSFTTSAFQGTSGGSFTIDGIAEPLFALGWDTGDGLTASMVFPDIASIDDVGIFTFTGAGTNPQIYDLINLKVYNINLSVDVEYPFIQPSSTAATTYADPNFGFKVPRSDTTIDAPDAHRATKDINSTDMRDFVIHSRCQSPLVMAVKTEASAITDTSGTYTKIIRYTTPTGVASWVFGYIKRADGSYLYAPYFGQAYPRTNIETATTYSIGWSGTDIGATLLVLRDPMFSSNDIQAVY